jgi:hypothetical protein
MKLCKIGKKGEEKPAPTDDEGQHRDLLFLINDFDPSTNY